MNRPEKLNAIDKKMMEEFRDAFVRLDEREDVKVVALRGAGRAFTAGADLSWSEEMTPQQRVEHNRIGQKTFDLMERMETPVFAAVHGYCLGGGLELALAADFIVCSSNARLGLPEITLSADPPYRPKIAEDGDPDQPAFGAIVPGWGGPKRLPQRIGKAAAMELMYTGVHVDAERALKLGLVNDVYPEEEFDERVSELGRRMGAMNHYNLRLIKELVVNGYDMLEGHPS
jgi:enoyl-CoA hydratase